MFCSLENYPDDKVLNYDICIIGSGIAAHALISKFLKQTSKSPKRIAVLEGSIYSQGRIHRLESNIKNIPQEQELYEGEIEGWIGKNSPQYLSQSRERSFGGTMNIWSGWCWPLEPEDLNERNIRSGFSWPIPYDELLSYYHEAQNFFRLDDYEYENPYYWIDKFKYSKLSAIPLKGTPFRTRMLHFNPSCINDYLHDQIRESSTVEIFNNANCLFLETTQTEGDNYKVCAAVARTLENKNPGRIIRFQANKFILAAGAIETTRLLLLSNINSINPEIGKNFIEHPYLWVAAKFKPEEIAEEIKNFYFSSRPLATTCRGGVIPTLVPHAELIESKGIGNFRILLGGAPHIPGTLNVSWEQMPNLENTISLSDAIAPDIFGQKRIKVKNMMTQIDKQTIITAIKEGQELFKTLGYGKHFEIPELDEDPLNWEFPYQIVPGNHPMGTTRMSLSPEKGVVDKNCLMHHFKNLYIASSSTFPTGGYANPTFTIVALALRLADHIYKG